MVVAPWPARSACSALAVGADCRHRRLPAVQDDDGIALCGKRIDVRVDARPGCRRSRRVPGCTRCRRRCPAPACRRRGGLIAVKSTSVGVADVHPGGAAGGQIDHEVAAAGGQIGGAVAVAGQRGRRAG